MDFNYDNPYDLHTVMETGQFPFGNSQTPGTTTTERSNQEIDLKKLKWTIDGSSIGRDCASRQIRLLINTIGNPDVMVMQKGGFAMWKNETIRKKNKDYSIYERIEIWDDNVISDYPFEHYSSLAGFFKIDIPVTKLAKVLSISTNISYDIPAKLLKIRGRNLKDIVSITTLVCLLIGNEITLENIKEYKLVYKYMATLQPESKYYKKNGFKSFIYKIWQIKK